MKTRKSLLILGMVFLSVSPLGWFVPAQAAIHEGSDILGLATAPDETGEFSLLDQPLGDFDLCLVVYGFDHSQGIVGWECQIVLPTGVLAHGVTLNGKADPSGVDLATCNLQVFPRIPLLTVNGVVHLATLHLEILDGTEDKEFLLAPYSAPTTSATMNFSLETSVSNLVPFGWPGDCQDCSVFEIITTPEPTVGATWDLVKSLYR